MRGLLMVSPQDIENWIEQGLPNSKVKAAGDGVHFDAVVVCADFAGKNTMQRHRMVYQALGERMHSDIHALSLKTYTPDEQH